jgi:hypothetical protein
MECPERLLCIENIWDSLSNMDRDGLPADGEALYEGVGKLLAVLEKCRKQFAWAIEELFVEQVITDWGA